MEDETVKELLDVIREMHSVMTAAQRSGDWVVDGAADPDAVMSRAEWYLWREGYRRDSISGQEFVL